MVSPPQLYEVNDQVCKITCADFQATAGTDKLVIAAIPAVAGVSAAKIIRFMGCRLVGQTAAGFVHFKSGSGGSAISGFEAFPAPTLGIPAIIEVIDSGYYETAVGVGLYADVITSSVYGSVFYIAYSP